ncbi:unnamed protein product [Linum tenue]|uniref:Uncharacterized protein n=1 Tax=Linum tenue TaxID=586396 RepID=A0AAV0KJ28_9ROSI|nr:unnamed protein product [Linum tenue]
MRFPVANQILPPAARTQPRRVAFNIKQKEERGKSGSGDFEKKLALPLPTATTEKKLIRQKRSGSASDLPPPSSTVAFSAASMGADVVVPNGNACNRVEDEYIRSHHHHQVQDNQCSSSLVKHVKAPLHLPERMLFCEDIIFRINGTMPEVILQVYVFDRRREGIDREDDDPPHLSGEDNDPPTLPTLALLPFPAKTTKKNMSQSSEFLEKLWSGVGCTLGKTNRTEQGVEHVPDYKRERLGSLQNGAMRMKIFMVQQLLMSSFNES